MSGAPILFVVVGKPTEDDEKHLILSRLSQELKTWNEHLSGCKLETELENLVQPDVKVAKDIKELVLSNDRLSLVVLYNPTVATFKYFSKQYLAAKSCYRQLIYSGPALGECGSWLLQDSILQFGDLARILKEVEMPDFEPFYINAFSVGKWTQENMEKSTSFCIKLNPEPQERPGRDGIERLMKIISAFFDELASGFVDFDEKEKFSVSCFRAPNQNSSVIKVGDFKMIINGDSTKLPAGLCKGSDLVLLTTLDARLLKWLERSTNAVEKLNVGMLYSNALSTVSHKAPEGSTKGDDGLLINAQEMLKSLKSYLGDANIPIQSCYALNSPQPITVYHKAGFGTLEFYPLSPTADNKEVREHQKGQSGENILSNFPATSCILLWQPFNKKQKAVRLFFSGLVKQQSVLEGLSKLRSVCCFSNWEGSSSVENANKLNKLKSKAEKTAGNVVNGNAQKSKDAAKSGAVKQKTVDSSSVTSHSGHGDSITATKTQTKPKTQKNGAADKNQTLPILSKTEKSKQVTASASSTPGKSDTPKQDSKQTKPTAAVPARTSSRQTTKEAPVAAKPAATTAKPQAPGLALTAKQAAPIRAIPAKPSKEMKPAAKTAPPSKTKPLKSSTPNKKESTVSEKVKSEASPRLERRSKLQKVGEKKDSEKVDKKEIKAKIMETPVIKDLEVDKKQDDLINVVHVEEVSKTTEDKKEEKDAASPEKENFDVKPIEEQPLIDEKLEGSDMISSEEGIEVRDEKSDMLTSSKEPEDLADVEAASSADGRGDAEDEERCQSDEKEMVESAPEIEADAVCDVDERYLESQRDPRVHDVEQEVMSDDVEEDSLANEVAQGPVGLEDVHTDVDLDVDVDVDLDEMQEEETEEVPGRVTIPAPCKQFVDEMVRSGISLAESAGTESAPNENLYSQDLEDESPMEEEDGELQMEKTLLYDSALASSEVKMENKSELSSPLEPVSTEGEKEECIEKEEYMDKEECIEKEECMDKEECIEKEECMDKEECIEKDVLEELEKSAECRRIPHLIHQMPLIAFEEEVVEQETVAPVEREVHPEEGGEIERPERDEGGERDLVERDADVRVNRGDAVPVNNDAEFEGGHSEVELQEIGHQEDEGLSKCVSEASHVEPLFERGDCKELAEPESVGLSEHPAVAEINSDRFVEEEIKVGKGAMFGEGDEELRRRLDDETSPSSDRVFDERIGVQDQLIDFDDIVPTSSLKKDGGVDNLAALCGGINPSMGGDADCCSESADSTKAVAGSASEPQQWCGNEEDDCARDSFGQLCGDVANHLDLLMKHQDAVQKEFMAAGDKDAVFYNKGFHKERAEELSEEDQDELETISEHPEIEEEEEEMNKTELTPDRHATPIEHDATLDAGQPINERLPVDLHVGKNLLGKHGEGVSDDSPMGCPAIHSSVVDELVAAWGDPMNLPSPEKPKKLNLKKEAPSDQETNPPAAVPIETSTAIAHKKRAPAKQSIEHANKETSKITSSETKPTHHKSQKSAAADSRKSEVHKTASVAHPFYTDVAFVYERDDLRHNAYNVEFFKKVRSHCYILSSVCPSVLDHLLEAKQAWEGADVPTVVAAGQMDWSKVEGWIDSKRELLDKLKVTVVPEINGNVLESDLRLHSR